MGTAAGLWEEAQAAEGSSHWAVSELEYGDSSAWGLAPELIDWRKSSPKGELGPQALSLPAGISKQVSATVKPGRGFIYPDLAAHKCSTQIPLWLIEWYIDRVFKNWCYLLLSIFPMETTK